jgi:hypothetical protein
MKQDASGSRANESAPSRFLHMTLELILTTLDDLSCDT